MAIGPKLAPAEHLTKKQPAFSIETNAGLVFPVLDQQHVFFSIRLSVGREGLNSLLLPNKAACIRSCANASFSTAHWADSRFQDHPRRRALVDQ